MQVTLDEKNNPPFPGVFKFRDPTRNESDDLHRKWEGHWYAGFYDFQAALLTIASVGPGFIEKAIVNKATFHFVCNLDGTTTPPAPVRRQPIQLGLFDVD